jgi:hypothetical protein
MTSKRELLRLQRTLELASGRLVGIESKFTGWLTPKRRNKELFKSKYFEEGAELWRRRGLPRCHAAPLCR